MAHYEIEHDGKKWRYVYLGPRELGKSMREEIIKEAIGAYSESSQYERKIEFGPLELKLKIGRKAEEPLRNFFVLEMEKKVLSEFAIVYIP